MTASAPARLSPTGVSFTGVCEFGLPGCLTPDRAPARITAVLDSDGMQHDVCDHSLEAMRDRSVVRVTATGVCLHAVCELGLEVCTTRDRVPRPISAVFDGDGFQHNVCQPCLKEMLARGEWVLGGEGLPGPRGAPRVQLAPRSVRT